ncbi:pilus assembly protein TadG-related protein [Kribbella sp. NPDC026611]|uniref:pilus assembly protein TadG-related protein n=1 Tax=Kribbella sp. NPDC026611 TaxID=3154911 RepID=UPI0033E1E9AE
MTHNESGSATFHTLFATAILLAATAAATLYSAITTTHHRLTTAADLSALSAAQSLLSTTGTAPSTALNASSDAGLSRGHTAGSADDSRSAAGGSPNSEQPARPAAVEPPASTACQVAARIAAAHQVELTTCQLTPTSVTVEVSTQLDLRVAHPTLTATSRAGPV